MLACGPSLDQRTIKTPQQRMLEQEELASAEELEARKNEKKVDDGDFVDPDAPGVFDDKQAELELKRATLSAETCPEVVDDKKTRYGKTSVTITFKLDGSVAEATVPPPFEDTRLGNCALNAYRGIFVPPYIGERKVITWDVDLSKPKKKK